MGKSSINGPFSMAMLNNQRVKTKGTESKCHDAAMQPASCTFESEKHFQWAFPPFILICTPELLGAYSPKAIPVIAPWVSLRFAVFASPFCFDPFAGALDVAGAVPSISCWIRSAARVESDSSPSSSDMAPERCAVARPHHRPHHRCGWKTITSAQRPVSARASQAAKTD